MGADIYHRASIPGGYWGRQTEPGPSETVTQLAPSGHSVPPDLHLISHDLKAGPEGPAMP